MTSSERIEQIETVDYDETICMYECSKVATHRPVMSEPCHHAMHFCLEHSEALKVIQQQQLDSNDLGGWKCLECDPHYNMGLIVAWRPLR